MKGKKEKEIKEHKKGREKKKGKEKRKNIKGVEKGEKRKNKG